MGVVLPMAQKSEGEMESGATQVGHEREPPGDVKDADSGAWGCVWRWVL